uniref:Rho-GAP domain-containing protein n=1 Tax=Anolis carolinensis TaxID=28377 RepID=A0A803TRW2_ANOCA
MSVENLATVFGVNLIRPKVEDPVTIMKGTPQIQRVVAALIRGHERFFPPSKDQRPPLPQQANDPAKNPGPRNAVGWDAVPFPAASGSGTLWEAVSDSTDDGEPSGRGPSAEGHGELPARAAPEPRKRTQTLPNRKCFGTVPGLGENDIFRSSFWTSSSSLAQLHPGPDPDPEQNGITELERELEAQKKDYEEQMARGRGPKLDSSLRGTASESELRGGNFAH